MRKLFKNILVCATATVLAAGTVALTACNESFTPLTGDDFKSTEAAVSNGGFAVEYGKYVYFINGAASHEDDNTFGTPVKGALMRISKENLKNKTGEAETVIPSLMVSGDYTAGFFIYNDRVYYATPTNVKNMSGEVEYDWLDFKSASLNGSDVRDYFRLSDNATSFRFVQTEKGGRVYLLYNGKKPNDNDGTTGIQSYDTETGTCTTIAEGATAYVFNSTDKTDPYVYYTMPVKNLIDSDSPITLKYNQIYRASAAVTEAPYEYTWDQEYLDEHDGVAPYLNLGTLVLDGIGQVGKEGDDAVLTPFTHDYKEGVEPLTPQGYTYTLQSYTNGGIYFTRKGIVSASDDASLYYLSAADFEAQGWNSILGNREKSANALTGKLDIVANSGDTANASTSALFYIDGQGHHYIYVSDNDMVRADVDANGKAEPTTILHGDASGVTLVRLDNKATAQQPYDYVWFTRTNGSGMSVERAVYNGTKENYETLDLFGRDNAPYKALKVLDLQHKSSWYPYETISDVVMFADAETVGSASYDYIGAVSLTDKNGKYLNNAEFKEQVNDKWDSLMDSDSKTGYFAKLTSDGKSNLSNALTYYFRTGKTDAFYSNIQDAIDLGKKDTYLYTEDEKTAFKNFTDIANEGADSETKDKFLDGETSYRTRSYFIATLGKVTEDDQEAMDDYWKTYLKNYTVAKEENTGLEDWEIALCVVIPVLALAAVGLTLGLVLPKKKRAQAAEKPERMRVDTTVDETVDVYGNGGDDEKTEENTAEYQPDSGDTEEEAVEETTPESDDTDGE